jgi:hypothetical protein
VRQALLPRGVDEAALGDLVDVVGQGQVLFLDFFWGFILL